MTKQERMLAFSMRCDGYSYEEIGEQLSYEPRTISKDLHTVLEKSPRTPLIRYPAIREFVRVRCGGSIERFAERMRVSPHRLRRFLVHGDMPTERMLDKITEATGLTREEAFSDAMDLP